MSSVKNKMARLILGKKGGKTRMQILRLISKRPSNTNQLALAMDVNYNTVQYHINILLENKIITSSQSDSYGKVFFLDSKVDKDMIDEMGSLLNVNETPVESNDKLLSVVFDNSPIGMVLLNNNIAIFKINHIAKSVIISDENEIVGAQPGEALRCMNHYEGADGCGTSDNCHVCPIRAMLSDTAHTGKSYSNMKASLDIKTEDGVSEIELVLSSTPIYYNGERMILLTILSVG